MFGQLSQKFSTIVSRLQGYKYLSIDHIDKAVTDIRVALIEADVALSIVEDFCAAIRSKAGKLRVAEDINPGTQLVRLIKDEMVALIGSEPSALLLKAKPPVVILMAGLQGVGKTTSVAKLARYLERQRKMVAVVSCDIYRPAAVEQLAVLCQQTKAACYPTPAELRPPQIAKQAYARAARELFDVLIIDTAGRLHIDAEMMAEIRDINAAVKANEILLAVDSMSGQDAVNSAKTFAEHLPLTGIVLTKADGDSRGGAALSARVISGKPIKLIGSGEKLDQLEAFEASRIASRILGLGEIQNMLEDIKRKAGKQGIKKLRAKAKRAQLNLNDMKAQITQVKKMGGVAAMVEKMPAAMRQNAMFDVAAQEEQMKVIVAVIDSMTPFERLHPDRLNGSRKKRIAAGSGTTIQDINRVLKYQQMLGKTAKRMVRR